MSNVSEYSTRKFSFGDKQISDDSRAFVIAELGHNHQGNLETCLQMIRAAAFAGATAVKLQKRNTRELFTDEAFIPSSSALVFSL